MEQYWKFSLILISFIFNASYSLIRMPIPTDYDTRYDVVLRKLNRYFGLGADYVFHNDKRYPPIGKDVTFWLYSPGDVEYTQIFIYDENVKLKIVQNKKVGFLIHGWTDSFNNIVIRPEFQGWMKTTGKVWANNNNQTVICVDWNRLANYPYFIAALKNTKLVGEYLGHFIEFLQKSAKISLEDVTLCGHSLGGQICGFAGAYLKGGVKTIIALDPAGPLFTIPIDVGIKNRLDPTDAQFVQAIYTSCGTMGMQISSGHANYYTNGGAIQPGCFAPRIFGVLSDTAEPITCSHFRAVAIFRSACNPKNVYAGYQCSLPAICDVTRFILKAIPSNILKRRITTNLLNCSDSRKDKFGIYSKRISGEFNLDTTSSIA